MAYDGHDRERWVAEDPVTKRADRDDFARDRARLLHSASLRRLSAKTRRRALPACIILDRAHNEVLATILFRYRGQYGQGTSPFPSTQAGSFVRG